MNILKIILGAALIALGILVTIGTLGGGAWLGAALIVSGAAMVFGGVAGLLMPTQYNAFDTSNRGASPPRKVLYGRVKTQGEIIFYNTWGTGNEMLDLVIVLATHPCQLGLGSGSTGEAYNGIYPQLFFDQSRITLDTVHEGTSYPAGAIVGSGTSFSPVQTNVNISNITRSSDNDSGTGGGLVTVTLDQAIPYLQGGDSIQIANITTDTSLNGIFQVAEILAQDGTGYTTQFSFLNGGSPQNINNQGQAKTLWANYSNTVYVEYLDGSQTLGQSFINTIPAIQQNINGSLVTTPNPWTQYCSMVNCTAAFLRLRFDESYYQTGPPQISFHVRGKADIYDPRLGDIGADGTTAYSENAALVIADYLTYTYPEFSPVGFGYSYVAAGSGLTGIDVGLLTSQADYCDTAVSLPSYVGGGTEPLWAINGQFDCSAKRGEVLQNMLTSCGGRISNVGGQIQLNVAQWNYDGITTDVEVQPLLIDELEWEFAPPIRDLYNGVRGTFIDPMHNWTPTDYPYFCQDGLHGYSGPSEYAGDINLAADGGQRRWLNLDLPLVISFTQCQRLAKVALLKSRYFQKGTLKCNMQALTMIPFDTLSAAYSPLAWSDQLLEVVGTRLSLLDPKDKDTGAAMCYEVDVTETSSAIYDFSEEEYLTPQGVQAGNFLKPNFTEDAPFPWSPGTGQCQTGDATFYQATNVYQASPAATFTLDTTYSIDAQGNVSPVVNSTGYIPINPDTTINAPQVGSVTVGTGGSIPAGNYCLAVAGTFTDGSILRYTQYLDLFPVFDVANGSTFSVDVVYTPGVVSLAVYMAVIPQDELLIASTASNYTTNLGSASYVQSSTSTNKNAIESYQWHLQTTQSLAGNETGVQTVALSSYNPTTQGGPDAQWASDGYMLVNWFLVEHSGIFGQQIEAVTSSTITMGIPSATANQFAGYTLSLLSRYIWLPGETTSSTSADIIPLNMAIESHTATNGDGEVTFTIGANAISASLPDLTTLLNVNDVLVCRYKATFTANGFSDSNIANGFYPTGADDPASESSYLAVCLSGANYGDVQPIASCNEVSGAYTSYTLKNNWTIQPQTGDIVVVINPTAYPSWQSKNYSEANQSDGPVSLPSQPPNLPNQTWLMEVQCVSLAGKADPAHYAPLRDLFIFGAGGTREITASSSMVITDGTVLVDASGGDVTFTLLSFADCPNLEINVQKLDSSANTVTIQCASSTTDSFTLASGGTATSDTLTVEGQWFKLKIPA